MSAEFASICLILFGICECGKWIEQEYYGDQGELMIHRYQIPSNTAEPTDAPSITPTLSPSNKPSRSPIINPTKHPTLNPTLQPTNNPTEQWDSSPLKSKLKSKFSKKHKKSAKNTDHNDHKLLNELQLNSKPMAMNTNRSTIIYLYGMELQQRQYLSDLELYVLKQKNLKTDDLLLTRIKPKYATSAKIQNYHFPTDMALTHFFTFFRDFNSTEIQSFDLDKFKDFMIQSLWYLSQINPVIWNTISDALFRYYNISIEHQNLFHSMRYGYQLCTRLGQNKLESRAKSKLPFSLIITPATIPMVIEFLSIAIQLLANEKVFRCRLMV